MSHSPKQSFERDAVVNAARGWIKTPWRHKARAKGAGIDCAQLLMASFSEAGLIEAFETEDYPIDYMLHSDENKLCNIIEQCGGKLTEIPQRGDVIVWKFGRTFSHAAIIISWPNVVIHAYRPFGCVCETPADVARLAGKPFRIYTFW